MPYEIFLALRYLRSRRGRRAAQLTAFAAVFGIAFGVAALIFALALANGFRDELREKILSGAAHVTVARPDRFAKGEPQDVSALLLSIEGVRAVEPTTYAGALISGPRGSSFAILRGVDADSSRAISEIRRTLESGEVEKLFRDETKGEAVKGDASRGEATKGEASRATGAEGSGEESAPLIVGAELAARTGLDSTGAEGWLVTGEETNSAQGFAARSRRVRVAGIFRTGLYEYDSSWAYASFDDAARISNVAASSPVISIETSDAFASGEVARRVRERLGAGWSVVDWREANRPLFAALELERRTVSLIIALIIFVAALNITTTLALVVTERRADIAILSTLGARERSVSALFIFEGAVIGATGAALGVALGLAAVFAANRFELVQLPPDVYSLSAIRLRAHAWDVLWPALAAFAISLAATLYPARKAARSRPSEVLRYG